jgi:PIN domain nuclease of toxin-antitoxin system
MKALLDTHTLLWWALDDKRLSRNALALISDPGTQVFVSVVSLWEIVIKAKLEKLSLPGDPADILTKAEEQDCRYCLFSLPTRSRCTPFRTFKATVTPLTDCSSRSALLRG